jgi:cytochrome c oxidase subunit 2
MMAAVTVLLALALAACGQDYPNTTFDPHSEYGLAIDKLWDTLLLWGTIVFVLVEAGLIFIVFRYRRREGQPEPKHVHGNTTLEILWTVLPAVILVLIAVPTVRTIFQFQAQAPAGSLQINVTGHQWWWEFEYPEFGVKTANELYIPEGRTVSFNLRSADVIHSFWIPQLAGKRDLMANRTNYLWFTPDAEGGPDAWNGFCLEYCGASHANMKFRAFTVAPADFERWVAHQRSGPVFGAATPAVTTAPAPAAGGAVNPAAPPAATPVVQTAGSSADWTFPGELPAYVIPNTPIPAGIDFPGGLVGDATRGRQLFGQSTCSGCHTVTGVTAGVLGPNLTHVGSRTTIGAGLYRNDAQHLAAWIKNSPAMKPGSKMPPQGKGLRDPATGAPGFYEDAQIADLVAYLRALK